MAMFKNGEEFDLNVGDVVCIINIIVGDFLEDVEDFRKIPVVLKIAGNKILSNIEDMEKDFKAFESLNVSEFDDESVLDNVYNGFEIVC